MGTIVRATYSCVTPLFCGGPDPKEAELRLSSFKGVLRYWWRALAWSRLRGDLREIGRRERQLFGGPGEDGCSKVSMRLVVEREGNRLNPPDILQTILNSNQTLEGANYLGYGLVATPSRTTRPGQLVRGALAGVVFRIDMRVDPRVEDADLQLLLDALKAIGLLGGMGARSRRGFGSLVLERLTCQEDAGAEREEWQPPQDPVELEQAIAALPVSGAPDRLPEYTAFSPRSRVVIVTGEPKEHPLRLLDRIGREMLRYRSWGRNGRVLGNASERRFADDHDLMLQPEEAKSHPRRIAFGLPHNYFFSSLSTERNRSVRPDPASGIDRRASPLFIHIHRCGDTPAGVLTFLPARFLPAGTSISVNGTPVPVSAEDELYRPVEEFLKRLSGESKDESNLCKERFRGVVGVSWA